MSQAKSAEKVVQDIRRKTRRRFTRHLTLVLSLSASGHYATWLNLVETSDPKLVRDRDRPRFHWPDRRREGRRFVLGAMHARLKLTKQDRAGENQQSLDEDTTANGPPPIRQLSAPELKALIEGGTAFKLVDIRTDEERALAKIDGSRLLDQSHHDALLRLDPNTPIVFQCHHGVRSQHAAEYFRREGFRNLYNLRGGIDAWSQFVDPSVPRY